MASNSHSAYSSARTDVATLQEEIVSRYTGHEAALLRRALDFAATEYAGRVMSSGEPVFEHAVRTAAILSEINLGPESLAAALLYPCHDLLPGAVPRLRETFGNLVAELAEGVVRMAQIGGLSTHSIESHKPQQQAVQLEALRKMLLAMVQDVRVVLVKLADHLQTLRYRVRSGDSAGRIEAAELTRDIFAPLANRLGVWHLKWELEALAFRILEPATYRGIAALLDERRADRTRYIESLMAKLREELSQAGIAADISGRPKHIYSIYRKMQRKQLEFKDIYDVLAVRVLVDELKDCYAVLGIVHHLWSPLPREFDDYIAKPKSNSYRSLHTAVVGPGDKPVEIQIRTREMHQHSEFGVAAHWRYKEESRHESGYDSKIAWLRQILEWRDEVNDTGELAEQFKTGLFEDTVYVLTPQGRVIDLPKGATPVDFAYHVHTELGHRCRGAKVDGGIVPLNTALRNGQRVEILAAKQGGPSRDWLNPALGYLQSQAGRGKVRQWFNRQNQELSITQGRAALEKELQRYGMTSLNLDDLAVRFGHDTLNDFLAAMGRGEIGSRQLRDVLSPHASGPDVQPEAQTVRRASSSGKGSVLIVGVDKLLTVPAKCCKPVPPDAIVGFVTRGRGVSVHRADCTNVRRLDVRRQVSAEWGEAAGATYPVDIVVEAADRTGLLRDISEVLSRERINVTATSTQSGGLAARMRFTVEIADLEQLRRALGWIREVRGVVSAVRRIQ